MTTMKTIATAGHRFGCSSLSIAFFASLLLGGPASAQVDLSGEWGARYHEDQPERIPGPDLGDYLGIPINDAARLRGDSWDASLLTLPDWQCRPHPADYGSRGPANLRIWKDVDTMTQQVVAYHTHVQWQAQERTIWMDGRPHPGDDAVHTWQGFSTGKWEGDTLTVETSHLKEGYVRRNGLPRSDFATLTEHWTRHGNVLTLAEIIYDPVYLTEPYIRTTNWELTLDQNIDAYPCEVTEEVERAEGVVPHHLPGTNSFLTEFAEKFSLPVQATRGGAETMYPEYRAKMASKVAVAPAEAPAPSAPGNIQPSHGIHVQRVRGNIYMLSGAGGNITISVGDEGVMLVDAGLKENSDNVIAEVRKLSDKPIAYIIDTHIHPDHIGGNEKIGPAGSTIAGGDLTRLEGDAKEGAKIIAYQTILDRLIAKGTEPPTPFLMLPTDTYSGRKKDLFFNGEGVRILHAPAAHTDGDSLVFFRRSDVVSTGDVFITTGYPFLDLARGGGIQGEIAALNQILDLAIPAAKEEGGTYIVPGHGRLCDAADVAYYRDMITIIRDRVLDMKKKGMTVEQVKAARPTRDYDPRWGSTSGRWTTDMFVEAVYKTVDAKK
jgi:glyoxylase-like metal-dependent hydrolase (beta-lactamase superfamily II)